jgi:hypothetical protein
MDATMFDALLKLLIQLVAVVLCTLLVLVSWWVEQVEVVG